MTVSYEALTLRDGYDLDVLTKQGVYMVTDPTNGPDTGDWYVHVFVAKIGGKARQMQIAWSDADGSGQTRNFTGTTGWTTWTNIGGAGGGSGTNDTLAITGDITPTALAANTDDYAPAGLAGASVVRISSGSSDYNVTGLTTGSDGRVVIAYNIGTGTITFTAEDASSAAANRFGFGGDVVVGPGQSIHMIYDSTASRWRVVSEPDSGDTGGTNPTLAITGDISPTQLSASVNDYAPTGLADASVVRLDADAGTYNITGLTTGGDGRVVCLLNVGSNDITLTNEDASSTAANRFALDGAVVLRAGAGIMLIYDTTSSRWRQVITRQTDFQNVVLETFTAGGTWTKDSGLVSVNVIVVGGGGAGGGAEATGAGEASVGAGGSAGGIAIESLDAGDLGATETVTIGAAGTGSSGSTGGNGGTSSFGALCSATGGAGGTVSTAGAGPTRAFPGSAGNGSGGDLNIRGAQGGMGEAVNGEDSYGGRGADGEYGGGGEYVEGTAAAGEAGQGYGAGGSGAMNTASLTAKAGGDGAPGIVIVAEYY